jgi:hypothetical protein
MHLEQNFEVAPFDFTCRFISTHQCSDWFLWLYATKNPLQLLGITGMAPSTVHVHSRGMHST